ncbi:cyclin-dependent kinase inhibitor 2c [Anaeramoeba ignava]|uniref:Cyclin-dependent kinase inhibitor 2c n=1 Tax=Anaeramoeba ignava TaxID=1746090 RepID=A0A9Q0R709_ANAIG|nr:cyclin-dependent kinase inhibitor 2c [Anaeramoeba ignava]
MHLNKTKTPKKNQKEKKEKLKQIYEAIKTNNIQFFDSIPSLKAKKFQKENESFLNFAFENNSKKEIIELLISKGSDLTSRNKRNEIPLYVALRNQNLNEIIELLISKGSNINSKNDWGEIPLHVALERNYSKEIIELLISKGSDINSKNKDNLKEIIELLISKGSDLNSRNKLNEIPLHAALENKNSNETIQLLISKGSDVNSKNKEDENKLNQKEIIEIPLHAALENKNSNETIQLLISKGSDLNSKNKEDEIPLHIALKKKYSKEIIELLISKGSDLNSRNKLNEIPLHVALENKNPKEIIELLISKGSDLNSRNNQNKIPLHVALENKNPKEIIILLMRYLNIFELKDHEINQEIINLFPKIYSFIDDLNNFLKSNEFTDIGITSSDNEIIKAHKQILLIRFDNNQKTLTRFINICRRKPKEIIQFVLNFLYTGFVDFDKLIENFDNQFIQKKSGIDPNYQFLFSKQIEKIQKEKQEPILNEIEKQKEIEAGLTYDLFEKTELDLNWIKEKEGIKGILKDFEAFSQQNSTKDFTIIVEEKQIKVHKLILQIRSELFRGMFLSVNDSSNQVHDYSEKSFETINQLIYFFYNDEIDETKIAKENIEEFIDLKDFYQLNQKSILGSYLLDFYSESLSKK